MAKRNVKLTIEYDGTCFAGWQRQPGVETVQGALEQAIARVTGEETHLTGAGRTDAGVHAEGQAANFHTDSALPAEQLARAINYYAPRDISVIRAEDAPPNFHAQKCARSKLYRYRMLLSGIRRPLRSRFTLLVSEPLDIRNMQECAGMISGRRNFAAFASEQNRYRSTFRQVYRSELIRVRDELQFMIEADGFLYNMVRALVGTLLQAGSGKMTPGEFARLFEAGDRSKAGPTAPAHGLCLVSVFYER